MLGPHRLAFCYPAFHNEAQESRLKGGFQADVAEYLKNVKEKREGLFGIRQASSWSSRLDGRSTSVVSGGLS